MTLNEQIEAEFFKWHFEVFCTQNADLDIKNAKVIYERVHSHHFSVQERDAQLVAWVASATRHDNLILAPEEPTEDMLWAAWEAPPVPSGLTRRHLYFDAIKVVYKAMLKEWRKSNDATTNTITN